MKRVWKHVRPGSLDDLTPLMTRDEVAAAFGVKPGTVSDWVEFGRLRSVRILGGHHRFRQDDVEALLADDGVPSEASKLEAK